MRKNIRISQNGGAGRRGIKGNERIIGALFKNAKL
jgi:hypothetical protein